MKELHVVALSGGKDSTCMALELAEREPRDYVYICTPTGNELPEMFAHWRELSRLLGKPLTPVLGGTLDGIIDQEKMIPNYWARFCTRRLKIEPYAKWMLSQGADRIVSYVGIRADEPEREAGDYTDIPGVEMDFPLRRWGFGLAQVLESLEKRQITIPVRTDCALCFFQRLGEWWRLWKEHPEEYAHGEAIEAKYGHTFRSPSRDTWPASLAEMRLRFEAGDVPRGVKETGAKACRVCRI